MGKIETKITLVNADDEGNARGGFISEDKVRKATVQAIVDTGAFSLIITEELFEKLGLSQLEEKTANLANGSKMPCKITSGVIIHCQNRRALVEAVVIPGAERVLLGVIPLESMDFIADPKNQTLVGAHGDEAMCFVY
ncbi:MAG: retroviral-like aspartic protease family protein [Treponema sp.]|jgi:clan AA aspartic protease|nr:retroviral-like aspartic protease family protein [Treponema sp.]